MTTRSGASALRFLVAAALLSIASGALARPSESSIHPERAKLIKELRGSGLSRGIRRMMLKTLPTERHGGDLAEYEAYRHERTGRGKQWTRRFNQTWRGAIAGAFSPDGKRALIKNEQQIDQYQDEYVGMYGGMRFAETARIHELAPGRFDVHYDLTLSDIGDASADRKTYRPGTYPHLHFTVELSQPRTLTEMWTGNFEKGEELRQAILHIARLNTVKRQFNTVVREDRDPAKNIYDGRGLVRYNVYARDVDQR